MSAERGALIEKFLDGSLTEAEGRELLDLLAREEAFRRDLAEAMRRAGLVAGALEPASERRRLTDIVMTAVGASREDGRFASRVMRKVTEAHPAAAVPAPMQAPRPTSVRSSRRLSGGAVRTRRPARRLALVVAAAAVLLLGWSVLRVMGPSGGPAGKLTDTLARVQVVRSGSATDAVAGMELLAGDEIRTSAGARATVRLPGPGSTVELNERTSLALGKDDGGPRHLLLDGGDIYVRAIGPVTVNAGQYDQTAVLGTEFEVSRSPGATVLRAAEGRVRFGNAARAEVVAALQASRVSPGGVPSRPEPVTLADIASWRVGRVAGTAPLPPKVIYEDSFPGQTLAPFWTKADPPECARVGGNLLSLAVSSDGARPATVELTSQVIELGGRPVEVELVRNRADGTYVFLPLDDNSTLGLDLLDESGRPVCRASWKTVKAPPWGIGTVVSFAAGEKPLSSLDMPIRTRIFVGPDGRVAFVRGETLRADDSAGRKVESLRLRLRLTTQGTNEVAVRWTKVLVRRLEAWPELGPVTPAATEVEGRPAPPE